MVALSRPRHFVLFALALVALFGTTFRITQALHEAPPEAESLPALIEHPFAPLVPGLDPGPLADFVVAEMTSRECIATQPRSSGGLITMVVENIGEGTARGFRLYVGLLVENLETGASERFEREAWFDELAPSGSATMQFAYAFPQRDTIVLGPLVMDQPVPGPYRLQAVLDRPLGLPSLGDAGVVEEADEYNNSAETRTDGTADGLC